VKCIVANLPQIFLLFYRDGAVMVPPSSVAVSSSTADHPRSEIDEQPIPKFGGPTFKQVKPKTYQVLEEQLHSTDEAPAAGKRGRILWPNKSETYYNNVSYCIHNVRI